MLFPGREYLLAAVHGGRKRQEPSSMEAGSERKMERSYADQHRCAACRTTTRSKAKASPGNMSTWLHVQRCLTCVVYSEIAGATRLHPEARGDLHGRNHAHALRRLDDDLTLEQPQFRRAGPARRSSAWRPKVGRAIRRC